MSKLINASLIGEEARSNRFAGRQTDRRGAGSLFDRPYRRLLDRRLAGRSLRPPSVASLFQVNVESYGVQVQV